MERRNATVAVIGAGDYIGAAISKKFAAEGYTVFAGRRTADKLSDRIRAAGGEAAVQSIEPGQLMDPESIADAYWFLNSSATHGRSSSTFGRTRNL
jgi:NAD(P)-dependent dehydrogenase (short-subunit alcohol dehydrogenase family)